MKGQIKNTLIIRLDNLGDLIMLTPAIKIIKEQTRGKVTLLVSHQAACIAPLIEGVDEVIVIEIPWIKNSGIQANRFHNFQKTIETISHKQFDACFIFTVYSQSALTTALLPWLAEIPIIAAYCRENPYQLISHWIVDEEPFTHIKHELERNLYLLKQLGFSVSSAGLPVLKTPPQGWKIKNVSSSLKKPYIIIHPGASESKREYPITLWKVVIESLLEDNKYHIVLTGDQKDKDKYESLDQIKRENMHNKMGCTNLSQLCSLISNSSGMISVNTGPSHIAMSYNIPIVVLYAETNPQHSPWSSFSQALYYSIPKSKQSKNYIIQTVNQQLYSQLKKTHPSSKEIIKTLYQLINDKRVLG